METASFEQAAPNSATMRHGWLAQYPERAIFGIYSLRQRVINMNNAYPMSFQVTYDQNKFNHSNIQKSTLDLDKQQNGANKIAGGQTAAAVRAFLGN